MKCDRCACELQAGEETSHLGRTLCEDCYMDALSPVRTCDPWAVHSAKSFEKHYGAGGRTLTSLQAEILDVLKNEGPLPPPDLRTWLSADLSQKELEREFAALRHMEKVRAEKADGVIRWRLW